MRPMTLRAERIDGMPESSVTSPPMISVVIPSLNQGAFLEQAIQSVLSQTYQPVELIVMDGGSTDGSQAILERYSPQLAHWQSAPDDGPAAALNDGFAHARGAIFGWLNADDFLLQDALAVVARAFARSPADVVSGHGVFATESSELGAPVYSDRWSRLRFAYGGCVLVQPATFFRRSAFEKAGGFRRTGRVCWDMELWAAMAAQGARFDVVDARLAAFRLHGASITGRPDLQRARRIHARDVMAEIRGRPEMTSDRVLHLLFRVVKFAGHPLRTIRQRTFVRRTLKRWAT
jgi:glycosyltransferase involved in cell wall biosynthesis